MDNGKALCFSFLLFTWTFFIYSYIPMQLLIFPLHVITWTFFFFCFPLLSLFSLDDSCVFPLLFIMFHHHFPYSFLSYCSLSSFIAFHTAFNWIISYWPLATQRDSSPSTMSFCIVIASLVLHISLFYFRNMAVVSVV
jgi:hypothetical protein